MALTLTLARRFLGRTTYGPLPGDAAALVASGIPAWLDRQLVTPTGDSAATARQLAATRIRVATDGTGTLVPLAYLNASAATLLAQSVADPVTARFRPGREVQAATWVRAATASSQLHELMTRFWHNHFNVNLWAKSITGAMLPILDRDVIRPNAFGNFGTLLIAVAQSQSMMRYLDTDVSTKAHPNENFAREVMELHTLSAAAYEGVGTPGQKSDGKGYTDIDVTAAAQVLTGWTIANGFRRDASGARPATGAFLFSSDMHATGTKSVLGNAYPDATGAGEPEGVAMLTMLAHHPATARFVSAKMTRWLAGDSPTDALYAAALAAWNAGLGHAGQIAGVIRAIVLHPDFLAAPLAKIKDPFRTMVSLLRATGADWTYDEVLQGLLDATGYPLFTWATPDGIPDSSTYWTGTSGMLGRWTAESDLAYTSKVFTGSFATLMPTGTATFGAALDFWSGAMLDGEVTAATRAAITAILGAGGLSTPLPAATERREKAVRSVIAAIAQAPEFQVI